MLKICVERIEFDADGFYICTILSFFLGGFRN